MEHSDARSHKVESRAVAQSVSTESQMISFEGNHPAQLRMMELQHQVDQQLGVGGAIIQRKRKRDEDKEGTVQKMSLVQRRVGAGVANNTPIIIDDVNASDFGDTGIIRRRSRTYTEDNLCWAVEFDNEQGVLYRVYDPEMRQVNTDHIGDYTKTGPITNEEVFLFIQKNQTIMELIPGQTVHYKYVNENKDGNCHFYAFGGLSGNLRHYDFATLAGNLGATKEAERPWEDLTDVEQETYETEEAYLGIFGQYDMSSLNGREKNLDADGENATVISYGTDHSSRSVGGRVWHKFTTIPYIIAVPGATHLGYGVVAQIPGKFTVPNFGGQGTFVLPGGE